LPCVPVIWWDGGLVPVADLSESAILVPVPEAEPVGGISGPGSTGRLAEGSRRT